MSSAAAASAALPGTLGGWVERAASTARVTPLASRKSCFPRKRASRRSRSSPAAAPTARPPECPPPPPGGNTRARRHHRGHKRTAQKARTARTRMSEARKGGAQRQQETR